MNFTEYKDRRLDNLQKQIESLKCDHPTQQIRYRLASNETKMFKNQCTRCGELIGVWIPHKDIKHPDDVPPIDDSLKENYRQNVFDLSRELNIRISDLGRQDFFKNYNEYLLTSAWKEKRELVLKRASWLCEGCRKTRAVEVHHLTYDHIYDEFLFELVALCYNCHNRIHPGGAE